MDLPSEEFEIKNIVGLGTSARCRVCEGSQFVKLSNARAHAKSNKHRSNSQYALGISPPLNVHPNTTKTDFNDFFLCEPADIPNSTLKPPFPFASSAIQQMQDETTPMPEESQQFLETEMAPSPESESPPWLFDFETQEEQFFEEESAVEPERTVHQNNEGDWAPYPTKAMFLTDILFNSPRLRFSEAQKKAILQWGRDLGANDVPKYHTFKAFQDELNRIVGNPVTEKKTRNGNIFYLKEIGATIAKDFSNPHIRPYMNFFPEQSDVISQMWHASKWRTDLPAEYQIPMVIHPTTGVHFYAGELCQTIHNDLFIPMRWFKTRENEVYSAGFRVHNTKHGLAVQRNDQIELPLAALNINYVQLTQGGNPIFADCSVDFLRSMPNPKRIKAKGRPFFFVYIIIFIDDVSGNVSKQWNKHYVCYMSNAMLPREHLDKEFNVHFVSSSPSVNALELAQGIRESFEKSQEGTTAYDCVLKEEIVFEAIPILIAADNPMHAELTSSCGLTSNKFCRTCDVGGSQAYKCSDDGYLSLFQIGTLRTPANTKNAIMQQFLRALQPNSRTAIGDLVKDSGVKDTLAQPLIESLMELSYSMYAANSHSSGEIQEMLNNELKNIKSQGRIQNAFLEMKELDVHMDTPTEILHTILLGIVKYFWGQTIHIIIAEKKMDIFQARLQSISSDGLSIPQIMASYICQYRGALIGKHFKTIIQIMPNIIYDLIHVDLLHAWLLMGYLTVLCWHTAIYNMDSYLELKNVIEEFLTKTAICAPSIIVSKPKFHFLIHLPAYIRRFGPALLFATERYESFNSVFRSSSVHSNHLAPSRDIAVTFSQLDRVKHITLGGWWYDESSRQYVRASPHVSNYLLHYPRYSTLVGLHLPSTKEIGTMTMETKRASSGKHTQTTLLFNDTLAARVYVNSADFTNTLVFKGKSIVVKNGDLSRVGSAVIFSRGSDCGVALVQEILMQQINSEKTSLITLQILEVGVKRHDLLDFPLLKKVEIYRVVSPEDILCVVNIQHDCAQFSCPVAATKAIYQERQQTVRTHKVIQHKDDRHFVLNTLALHNYDKIEWICSQMNLPMRRYYNSEEHTIIRKEKAAQLRDKKQQAKAVKSSKESTVSRPQVLPMVETMIGNINVSQFGITPTDPSIHLQPADLPERRRQVSNKTNEASGILKKKSSGSMSRKKQDLVGLGMNVKSSQPRKRGKTNLTKEQIAANEDMLSRDVFDMDS